MLLVIAEIISLLMNILCYIYLFIPYLGSYFVGVFRAEERYCPI